ncbi:MAG: hypothetical protein AUI14_00750 [Actinobacteria bacterium 13_2_20CM_2_71_6]|nr:MAG: hypothetical protein AUI14_00750 [Actinobacteria bacterium 13_2_20CM_2_71_6]
MADIKTLIPRHRLITLTGVAGVGKTRLARRAADQLVRLAPGGVWWVELDQLQDPRLVPAAVLQAVDQHDQPGPAPVPRLVEFLADPPTVLVLDNCEHLVEACAELAGTLLREVPSLRILATSREALRLPDECVMSVEPLRVPTRGQHSGLSTYPAVALFCQRAAAAVPGFTLTPDNEATVAGICRRLDGLPLAIELAAVRLRALSAEQIRQRLDDRLDPLATGTGTASSRQRTLRGALDWSYELCTGPEQRTWAQLSVFSGTFDLAAAEYVSGAEPGRLAAVLDGLVGKSILVRAEDRYRLLRTVARYGREMLAGSGTDTGTEDRLRARHAQWYAGLARQAERHWFGPDDEDWLARLRVEHGNVRTALEFLLDPAGGAPCDHGQAALDMVGDLWFYWTNGAAGTEARHWLTRALALDPRPTPARARALWVAGYLATIRYDLDTASSLLDEAEEVATRIGDAGALAWTTTRRAILAMLQEDPRAEPLAQVALDRLAAAGEREGVGVVLTLLVLGTTRLFAGDVDSALRIGQRCRAICTARGDRTQQGIALLLLARAAWTRGELTAAHGYAQDALRLRPDQPAPNTVALALNMLGWFAGTAGDHKRVAILHGGLHEVYPMYGTRILRTPTQLRPHQEAVAAARAALGDAEYERLYERGVALGPAEIIPYALGEKVRREPAAETGPALTARERQIAGLVAGGLSNRQIASKLVISQRTAETHIEHVLRKLNFTSRAQIAAWAATAPDGQRDR